MNLKIVGISNCIKSKESQKSFFNIFGTYQSSDVTGLNVHKVMIGDKFPIFNEIFLNPQSFIGRTVNIDYVPSYNGVAILSNVSVVKV